MMNSSKGFMELLGMPELFNHYFISTKQQQQQLPTLNYNTVDSSILLQTTPPPSSSPPPPPEISNQQPATPNSSSISSLSKEEHMTISKPYHHHHHHHEHEQDHTHEHNSPRKQWRMLKVKMKKGVKKEKEARIAFITKTQVDHLEDGYRWRKYGQKALKNSPFPRSYYRCSRGECNVKKRVERCLNDPTMVITTYEGKHNHLIPLILEPILSPPPPPPPPAVGHYRLTSQGGGGGGGGLLQDIVACNNTHYQTGSLISDL